MSVSGQEISSRRVTPRLTAPTPKETFQTQPSTPGTPRSITSNDKASLYQSPGRKQSSGRSQDKLNSEQVVQYDWEDEFDEKDVIYEDNELAEEKPLSRMSQPRSVIIGKPTKRGPYALQSKSTLANSMTIPMFDTRSVYVEEDLRSDIWRKEYERHIAEDEESEKEQELKHGADFHDKNAPCACIPAISSINIHSMIYDAVKCNHLGHLGDSHRGVVFFNNNWGHPSLSYIPNINNIQYHQKRPKGKQFPDYQKVYGYPRGTIDPPSQLQGDHRAILLVRRRKVAEIPLTQATTHVQYPKAHHANIEVQPLQHPVVPKDSTTPRLPQIKQFKLLDSENGQVMHVDKRSDSRGIDFEKKHEDEQIADAKYKSISFDPTMIQYVEESQMV